MLPGQQVCGGICVVPDPPCSVDTDCVGFDAAWSGPSICDAVICGCSATKGCRVGCSADKECLEGTSCGSDHRCALTTCTAASGSCPVDFTCGSDGHCVRQPCTSDAQCSDACVEGACYHAPGICQLLAA